MESELDITYYFTLLGSFIVCYVLFLVIWKSSPSDNSVNDCSNCSCPIPELDEVFECTCDTETSVEESETSVEESETSVAPTEVLDFDYILTANLLELTDNQLITMLNQSINYTLPNGRVHQIENAIKNRGLLK